MEAENKEHTAEKYSRKWWLKTPQIHQKLKESIPNHIIKLRTNKNFWRQRKKDTYLEGENNLNNSRFIVTNYSAQKKVAQYFSSAKEKKRTINLESYTVKISFRNKEKE